MRVKDIEETIAYIKRFLTYDNVTLADRILYLPENELKDVKEENCFIIVQSEFFYETHYGKTNSIPKSIIDFAGTKVLFGEGRVEKKDSNVLCYADMIASTFFFLSRYEEMIRDDCRDCYGNFPARESFLFKNNLICRPIVDEYAKLILDTFSTMDSQNYSIEIGFSSITFTHDIDVPFNRYGNLLSVVKNIGYSILKQCKIDFSPLPNYFGIYSINPMNTWKYMIPKEVSIKDAVPVTVRSMCFIIATDKADTYTMSYIEDKKIKNILCEMEELGAELGLHTSYDGAEDDKLLFKEKCNLERVIGRKTFAQRNHYLRQLRPTDIKRYSDEGFTDDYTTGYNEMPGFRIGTTRVCKWINPENGKMYPINIHSLNIMDGSLYGHKPYQLQLKYDEARELCKKVIDTIYEFGGDLCVLWHNGPLGRENYRKKLYDWTLEYCKQRACENTNIS